MIRVIVRRRTRDNALAGVHMLWAPPGSPRGVDDPMQPCLLAQRAVDDTGLDAAADYYEADAMWPLALIILLLLLIAVLVIHALLRARKEQPMNVVWAGGSPMPPYGSVMSARIV